MRPPFAPFHCVALMILLLPGVAVFAGPADGPVPVAEYGNASEKDGARASAILAEHKIKSTRAGSVGMTIIVFDAARADEARHLLARAIKDEGLQIELIGGTKP